MGLELWVARREFCGFCFDVCVLVVLVCLGFCWFASPAEFGFCRVGVLSLLWVVGVGHCICGGLLVILYFCVFTLRDCYNISLRRLGCCLMG